MSAELIGWVSLAVLLLTVIVSIKAKVHIGILAMASAFILGFFVMVEGGSMSSVTLGGAPITELFPFRIFWMIMSVSLMLNVGNTNGTFDIAIKKMLSLTGGKRSLIPVYLYIIMAIAVTVGAGSSGVVVLLCTVAANVARDQEIDPVFMLMSVLCGCLLSIASPVAIIGIICNGYSEQYWGEAIAPSFMYPRTLAMSLVCFAIIYIMFKGWKLEKWPTVKKDEITKLNNKQVMTLIGMLVFVILGLVLGFELGLSAFLVAAVLMLLKCADPKKMISEVPWASVVMISGMCILIGVVRTAGGIDLMTRVLSNLMNKVTIKPIYSIIGSLMAMVTSITSVILPTMIPTIPDLAAEAGVNPYSLITALAFGANATCCSPLSSMGSIALGIMSTNPKWDSDVLFKKMFKCVFILLATSAIMAAIGFAG